MNEYWDKLQHAWQSQCSKTPDINPDQLLETIRLEQHFYFWLDVVLISIISVIGCSSVWFMSRDLQQNWPWLIYIAGCAWVAGYILFNRWRQRRFAAHYDDSVLAHVEWSIKVVEHQMRLGRTQTWWYVLPIALGCMIPPFIFFAMEYGERPLSDSLIPLLFSESFYIAIFIPVYWFLKHAGRKGLEADRRQLLALREFRETLLNEESGK